jgi:CheY-like chemotaxis protein
VPSGRLDHDVLTTIRPGRGAGAPEVAAPLQPIRAAMGRDVLQSDALVGVHVLVVDDDGDARDLLRTVLEYCGALVTVVAAAEEAMQVLGRVMPDVVVTDIAMPEHDGYWLVRAIRALPAERGGALPMIAITAHGEQHGPERTLSVGFQAHLRKPLDPWELCRAIASLIRRG